MDRNLWKCCWSNNIFRLVLKSVCSVVVWELLLFSLKSEVYNVKYFTLFVI